MQAMNVVIIEDEKIAADHLEKMILKYDKNIKIVAKLESVEESINWFRVNSEPDLIFLDIHLEDGLAFSIFEEVKITSPIIFTTAFDEYAIRAFRLKSIDYLLKPIMQEDLNLSLEKYKNWTNPDKSVIDVDSLFEIISNKGSKYKERISINFGQKIKSFNISEVAYFYSEQGISSMVLHGSGEYPVDYSLDQLTGFLNPADFFRVNRQFLVSIKSIKNIHVFPKSRLMLELQPPTTDDVFVTIDKVTKFKQWLGE